VKINKKYPRYIFIFCDKCISKYYVTFLMGLEGKRFFLFLFWVGGVGERERERERERRAAVGTKQDSGH
jgi:hypothetical protein